MSADSLALRRIAQELRVFHTESVPGIACWAPDEGNLRELKAVIVGASETPYAGGHFTLKIALGERYPFEPPNVRMETRIYHPNIDESGRICLDTLKSGPHGQWKPSLTLRTLLLTLQVLMSHPNPDDALVSDIVRFVRVPFDGQFCSEL